MNTLLDIFGSVLIAGMLFMLIIKLNLFSNQTSYTSDNELKLIQNTKTLAEIIDYDFRKVGYRHDKSSGSAIITADSTTFSFYADIDSNLIKDDIITYSTLDSTNVTGTLNPRDIILKRVIKYSDGKLDNLMSGPSLGLVKIKFTYLSASQNKIPYNSQLDLIRYIKTEMWVESSDAVADAFADTSRYSVTYWEFTIYPRNI